MGSTEVGSTEALAQAHCQPNGFGHKLLRVLAQHAQCARELELGIRKRKQQNEPVVGRELLQKRS